MVIDDDPAHGFVFNLSAVMVSKETGTSVFTLKRADVSGSQISSREIARVAADRMQWRAAKQQNLSMERQ